MVIIVNINFHGCGAIVCNLLLIILDLCELWFTLYLQFTVNILNKLVSPNSKNSTIAKKSLN